MRATHLFSLLVAFALGILGVAKASATRDGEYDSESGKEPLEQLRRSSLNSDEAGLDANAQLFFLPYDEHEDKQYLSLGRWGNFK